jgi:hypothetical protein
MGHTTDEANRVRPGAPPRRLRIVTRHATVHEFVRGFARYVDDGHVEVALSAVHPFDSTWLFSICLVDGRPVFEGVGRLVEILPGRDVHGRVATRLALVWLSSDSSAMHQELRRAGEERDLARGTGGPFRTSALPLPAPPLPAFDASDDGGIDAATQLYRPPAALPPPPPPRTLAPLATLAPSAPIS